MRLRFHFLTTCVLVGIGFSHIASSFDVRRRREVQDSAENYRYYVRPFVVPEPESLPQPDPLLKAQSVAESTSAKQYKPPLLALPSISHPAGTGGYQPPIPLLAAVPRPPDTSRQSVPLYPATDITELSQSPPERRADAIDNRSKAVGSSRHRSQAIHQVPASEIQSDKSALAKDRDSAKNDEYVVYYYYYYDNDTNANNLTLNFDDIPSLDSYDEAKSGKEPAKSASSRSIAANVNALTSSAQDQSKDNSQRAATRAPSTPKANTSGGASQPRSLSSSDAAAAPVIRADKPDNTLDDTIVQPLKPVSNVFRYGSNEVPRFPVLPNFIVSEVPKEVKPEEQSTQDTLSTPPSTTLAASTVSGNLADERLQPEVDSDDANNVLDTDTKVAEEHEDKVALESSTTTTTTTTTELPTTTEIQTTTTEKSRRRPGLPVGGRRRFSGSSAAPPPPPSPRGRQTPTRAPASSSSTVSTTSSPSSTRSFRGSSSNRLRPRQPIGGNRPRPSLSSTKAEDNEESGSSKAAESTSTTAASRSRFSTTAAPRRFAGSRNSISRSTASTTASSRLRTTSRPRPNIITRNRPRPGFLRPRPGKEEEPETVETTTPEPEVTEEKSANSANPAEETEPDEPEESESPDTETPEAEEEETEEPTTTEKSRFAALFRPRNRNGNGNRPRPVIANRPSRSRR